VRSVGLRQAFAPYSSRGDQGRQSQMASQVVVCGKARKSIETSTDPEASRFSMKKMTLLISVMNRRCDLISNELSISDF